MGTGGFGKSLKIVSAFQQADQPVAGMFLRQFHQLSGCPVEIVGRQFQTGERIAIVGVKPGGNQDEVRTKLIDRGQYPFAHGLLERTAAIALSQWCVEDVADAGFVQSPGSRIEWHLVGGGKQHGFIFVEDVLGTIAVMDIEIDNRHPFGAVFLLGVSRGNGNRVDKAEAHRRRFLGMMAGWAHGAEHIVGTSLEHIVDPRKSPADCPSYGFPAFRRGGGIGIDLRQACFGDQRMNALDIGLRVRQLETRRVGLRRLLAFQLVEDVGFENLFDCPQPVRPLGMARHVEMLKADGMGINKRGQDDIRSWCAISSALALRVKNRTAPWRGYWWTR